WSATTAPPESLPLNQGTPRLSPVRSAAATPPAALTVPAAGVPEASEAQPSATQTSEAGASEVQVLEAQVLEAQTPGSAFLVHQGQSQPGSVSLSPQPAATPKDLPAAYCLHTGGLQASGLSLNPGVQAGAEPQGSEQHLDQLSTLVRAGSADAALALGERLNKAEPAAACLEENDATAEPAAAESRPAPPLN
ncbi:hypothetical protein C8255_16430, partial [filamentous cyanobacterium CCP3]